MHLRTSAARFGTVDRVGGAGEVLGMEYGPLDCQPPTIADYPDKHSPVSGRSIGAQAGQVKGLPCLFSSFSANSKLPLNCALVQATPPRLPQRDRDHRSEEHTSELQSR